MEDKKKKRDQDSHHSSEATVPGCHVAQLCRLPPGWTVKGCSEASQAGLQASEIHHTRCCGCGVWKLIRTSGPLCSSAQIGAGASAALQGPEAPQEPKAVIPPGRRTPHEQRRGLTARFPLWPSDPARTLKEAQRQLLPGAGACTFQMPRWCICLPNPLLRPPSPAMFFFHSFTKYTNSVSSVSAGVDQSST